MGASNPQDEMFIVTFNEKVSMGLPKSIAFTADLPQLRSALLGIVPAGLTALYDALSVGLDHLKSGTKDRKSLVVLSDGGDNASRYKLDDIIPMAQQSSATIYTIGIYDLNDPDRNPGALRKIANLTAGRAYFPKTVDDLSQVWLDIAGGIRSQYTVGYLSSNPRRDGTFRKVKIVASAPGHKDLRVSTRDGYVAAPSKVEVR
jgi:Ca-activated chloride channel homolog